MGSAQTSIHRFGQPIAIAGMCTLKLDSDSVVNKESSTNMGFGLGVKPGVKVKEALLPTASSSVLLGVVVWNAAYAPGGSGAFGDIDQTGSPPGLIPGTMLELITKGRVWVQVDADASITVNVTRAYWRFESDGSSNTLVGTFRHSDDGHVVDVTKQAIFRSGVVTAADGTKIAEIEINASAKP